MSIKGNAPLGEPTKEYLGPGAVYFNYGELDEACVGATKDGGEFNDNAEFRQHEADGDIAPVKGAIDLIKIAPQLTVNALKLDKANLQKFYAGMSLDDTNATFSKLTRTVNLKNSYLKNVAYVGQNREGKDLIIVVKNALGDGALQAAFKKDEEIVPSVQFSGTIDPATFDRTNSETYPYQIWLQKADGQTVTFTVHDDMSSIVAGATVTFDGISKVTDANGVAVFNNVPTGINEPVRVEKAGYLTYQGSIDVDGTEAKTITLLDEQG